MMAASLSVTGGSASGDSFSWDSAPGGSADVAGRNMKYKSTTATVSSALVFLMLLSIHAKSQDSVMDRLMLNRFTSDGPSLQWYVQNDNVMGGRSEGGFIILDSELVFSGTTNTNGGGFSSIRTQRFSKDLSQYTGIRVKVRADGRKYTWSIQTDARWQGRQISYWADFETNPDEVSEIDIPFSEFAPQFRGLKLEGPTLDASKITEFALYQYDKTDGPFTLRLISVEAY
ncbi:CIA30 family protein [Gammaproteobacteria bacterium LSUCC0112]|nr:CIA30 family protein [Gammaproteobacteria bacterium LSUCC0112]